MWCTSVTVLPGSQRFTLGSHDRPMCTDTCCKSLSFIFIAWVWRLHDSDTTGPAGRSSSKGRRRRTAGTATGSSTCCSWCRCSSSSSWLCSTCRATRNQFLGARGQLHYLSSVALPFSSACRCPPVRPCDFPCVLCLPTFAPAELCGTHIPLCAPH